MTVTLPRDLEVLLDTLDGLAVDLGDLGPKNVEAFLGERQKLLTRIQNHDTSVLTSEQRTLLKERLVQRMEADKRLTLALADAAKSLQSQQESVNQGRAAVRGYAGGESRIGPAWRRQA